MKARTLIRITFVLLLAGLMFPARASETGKHGREEAWNHVQERLNDLKEQADPYSLDKGAVRISQSNELSAIKEMVFLQRELDAARAKLQRSRNALIHEVRKQTAQGIKVPYVIVSSYQLWLVPENLNSRAREERRHYGEVRFRFVFTNLTRSTVTGLIYTVKFVDGFGDVLYEKQIKQHIKIAPLSAGPTDSSYVCLENKKYIQDDPYDKVWEAVKEDTVEVKVSIDRIAWLSNETRKR